MARKKVTDNKPPASVMEVIEAFHSYQDEVKKGLYSFEMYVPVLIDAKKFQGHLGAFKQNIARRSRQGKLTVEELAWYKLIAPYKTTIKFDDCLVLTRACASKEEDDELFDSWMEKGGAKVYPGYSKRNREAWERHTDLMLETCVDKRSVQVEVDLDEIMMEVPDDYFDNQKKNDDKPLNDVNSVDELF